MDVEIGSSLSRVSAGEQTQRALTFLQEIADDLEAGRMFSALQRIDKARFDADMYVALGALRVFSNKIGDMIAGRIEDARQGRIVRPIVLAGNYKQYLDWCRKAGISPQREAIYATDITRLYGHTGNPIVRVGTYEDNALAHDPRIAGKDVWER